MGRLVSYERGPPRLVARDLVPEPARGFPSRLLLHQLVVSVVRLSYERNDGVASERGRQLVPVPRRSGATTRSVFATQVALRKSEYTGLIPGASFGYEVKQTISLKE